MSKADKKRKQRDATQRDLKRKAVKAQLDVIDSYKRPAPPATLGDIATLVLPDGQRVNSA